MATEIIMPKAGMAMERGTIIQWFKAPGEWIEAGEPLLEIETDKVAMEVEAEVSGYLLSTLYNEGDEVEVITTIGYLGEKGEVPPADADSGESGSDAPPSSKEVYHAKGSGGDSASRVKATPAARSLAREAGVELPSLNGTGKWGEIRRRDVEAARSREPGMARPSEDRISPLARTLAEQHNIDTAALSGSGPAGRIVKQDVLSAITRRDEAKAAAPEGGRPDISRPLTAMRRRISRRMTESHHTVPPVTLHKKIDVTSLLALRQRVNAELDEAISLTSYFVRAVALALVEAPYMRTALDENGLVERGNIDIGVAVALKEGLIVPVLRTVDTLSVKEIHHRSKDLFGRAREGRLNPDELNGAVFSITNLGMYGISSFTPIINPPETAILGINSAEDELFLQDGEVRSRKVLTLSLTIDHRVIDGAQGAMFLQELETLFNRPMRLLV